MGDLLSRGAGAPARIIVYYINRFTRNNSWIARGRNGERAALSLTR